jgi:hypothetical protein
MAMTNHSVVKRFLEGKGKVEDLALNNPLHVEDYILHSYRLPIAWWNHQGILVLNGDSSTMTTNRHQSIVLRGLRDPHKGYEHAFVSFQALRISGVMGINSDSDFNILDISPENWFHVLDFNEKRLPWKKDGTSDLPERYPGQTKFMQNEYGAWKPYDPSCFKKPGRWTKHSQDDGRWVFHQAGSVLIHTSWDNRRYLGLTDERQWALIDVHGNPNTVEEANQFLKPQKVKDAEEQGITVKRQGEWFFILRYNTDEEAAEALGMSKTRLRKQSPQRALPQNRRNEHHVTWIWGPDHTILCSGFVRHKNRFGRSTGEHSQLELDGWFEAIENMELQSWTVSQGSAGFD